MTLVELMVAMAILSIVMLVFTTTLSSMQRAVVEEDVRIRLNDQVRLAMQSIDRLVRSGNILYDPVDESGNDPFDAPRPATCSGSTRRPSRPRPRTPAARLWIVNDEQELLYRTWPVLAPEDASNGRSSPRVSSTGPRTSPPSRSTPPVARSPSSST